MERKPRHLFIIPNENADEDQSEEHNLINFTEKKQERIDEVMKPFIEDQSRLTHGWMDVLQDLSPDEQLIIWKLFELNSEEAIAEELGLTLDEVQSLRSSAEQKIGGELPF